MGTENSCMGKKPNSKQNSPCIERSSLPISPPPISQLPISPPPISQLPVSLPPQNLSQSTNQTINLSDVKLRGHIIIENSRQDLSRKQKLGEREDPISEKAKKMKGEDVKNQSNSQELKAISAKEVEECLQFELICDQNSLSSKESRNIVCGVHLKVQQLKELKERIPMDLVCVIDDSGSMGGKKAQLVRKSLKYLLKIMNEDDRISLISFDSEAKILCPFLRNNLDNKEELKKAIKRVTGKGSTNIEAGMEAGLWMLTNRKNKNPVTCMFLLTDGQDDEENVDIRVQKLIQEYKIQDTFIVNTYGYGADHDTKQMRNIAETHKGGYYYIEDVKKVSEWFVLSISGLLSAVGEDLRIKIKQKNKDLSSLTISQLYGGDQLWVKSNDIKGEAEIYLPHLIVGDDKFFVFDVAFDHTKFQLKDTTRNLIVLEAELEVKAVKQESIVRVSRSLQLEYKEVDQKEIQDNSDKDYYEELKVTRQRAVGGMKIKQATNLINANKDYDQAKQILQSYQNELQQLTNLKSNNGIKHLDEDIEDAIQKCKPSMFRQQSFEKMEIIHCQKRNSIFHMEDWNCDQQSVMNQFKDKQICLSDDSCDSGSDSDDDGNGNGKKKPNSNIALKKISLQNQLNLRRQSVNSQQNSASDSGSD